MPTVFGAGNRTIVGVAVYSFIRDFHTPHQVPRGKRVKRVRTHLCQMSWCGTCAGCISTSTSVFFLVPTIGWWLEAHSRAHINARPPPPPPPLYRIVDDDARREFKSRSCWTPSTPPGYGHDPTHNSTEHSSCISRRKIWGEWLVSRLLLLLLLSTSVTATISSFLTSFLLFYYVYCSCCRWGRKSPKGPNRTVEFTSIYSYFTQGFVWFTTLILSAIRQIAKIWSTHLIFDWERYVHPHRGRRSEHQTDLWIVQRRNLCASIFLKRNVLMLVALASG